jgi:GNAT superfamily N-acetyltransferase
MNVGKDKGTPVPARGERSARSERSDGGSRLRVMTTADIPAALELCRAARWNQIEADWRRFLALHPAGARVALDADGAVIGSVATLRYGGGVDGVGFDWLAMVLVRPENRRQGIASRLVEEAIALLGARAPVRLDATPAGELVYRNLAFVPEYELARMERLPDARTDANRERRHDRERGADGLPGFREDRELFSRERDASTRYKGGLSPSFAAMEHADLAEVLALDREVFGADRGALLRMLWQDAPAYALVDRGGAGGSRLEGFAFGRHGFSFDQLGPIVARDESAARRLVGHLVASNPSVAFLLDVPRQSASWVAWLGDIGFREQRGFVRLVRGGTADGADERLFATIGADFG